MRLLITGGSSYLGSQIMRRAPDGWQIAATYFAHPLNHPNVAAIRVDMRDGNAVQRVIAETQPDAIVHMPAVMRGEMLSTLNVDGPAHVARAAAKARTRLIHISSDVIFDGEHAPYDENAVPDPITPYAESKARAEDLVRAACPDGVIVRTSLIYGFDPMDVRTRDILAGSMPRLFSDEFRCPIFVHDLADALIELAQIDYRGTINVAGPQKLSRYEFGLKLARGLGIEPRFAPALSASHPTPRPRDCTLDSSLAQQVLRTRLRSVDEVLSQILRLA